MNRLNEIEKQMEELRLEKLKIQEEERKEKIKIETERKKKLESEKESRWNEINKKQEELKELYSKYLEDYGSFSYKTYGDSNTLLPLLSLFREI